MTTVVREYPPLIKEIDAVFHVIGKPILYAWGDRIYNPLGVTIPPALMAHELVHCERQLNWGVDQWWRDYLMSDLFRLDEELLAHRAEYQSLIGTHSNRHQRRGALKNTARRLAAPLYGGLVSPTRAAQLLKEE